MPGVDWNKVAADYAASALDLDRLMAYARQVAGKLREAGIAYTGFTDSETASFHEGRRKNGFWKTVFKDKSGLDYEHTGYWKLEETWSRSIHNNRQKTRVKNYMTTGPSHLTVQENRHSDGRSIWALLADGRLAFFSTWHYEATLYGKKDEKAWSLMTVDQILLLDHKTRSYDRLYNNRSGMGWEGSQSLSSDNYLLTGRKGGGCSKKLRSLLEANGLWEKRAAQPRRQSGPTPAKPSLPISATYTLSVAQLAEGAKIRHTFKNGSSTMVTINPKTPSGKVIVVRTKASDGPEAIRLLQQ